MVSTQRFSIAGSRSIRIPRDSSTSAPPHFEVTPRLPCFTTTAPPAAITNMLVVEILNNSILSPPVPQTSSNGPESMARSIFGSMARSSSALTKAAISPAVSPFSRNAFKNSAFTGSGITLDNSPSIAAPTRTASRSEPFFNKEINVCTPHRYQAKL